MIYSSGDLRLQAERVLGHAEALEQRGVRQVVALGPDADHGREDAPLQDGDVVAEDLEYYVYMISYIYIYIYIHIYIYIGRDIYIYICI